MHFCVFQSLKRVFISKAKKKTQLLDLVLIFLVCLLKNIEKDKEKQLGKLKPLEMYYQ